MAGCESDGQDLQKVHGNLFLQRHLVLPERSARETDSQAERQAGSQRDRQTVRETGRQSDSQTFSSFGPSAYSLIPF